MIFTELVEVPLVLEQQHGPIPGIAHGLAVENAAHGFEGRPTADHPTGHREAQGFEPGFHPIFVLQPVLDNLQLQLTHGRQDRITLALVGVIEHLDGPFFAQLVHPLAETLEGRRVGIAQPGKDLRAEAGNPFVFNARAHIEGIADGKHTRIIEADHIAWIGIFHHFPVLAKQLLGSGEADGAAAAGVLHRHVLLKLAATDPHKGNPVTVARIHVGLQLEDKATKTWPQGINRPLAGLARHRFLG